MNLALVDPFVLAQDCPEVLNNEHLRECCLLHPRRPWRPFRMAHPP